MDQNFMKTRRVFPLVIAMACPMAISMLVNSLYNIIDSYFVAKISEDAMTALSLCYPVQNMITSVGVGFGIGINAAIAYYLGAKDKKTADAAASHGLIHSVIQGILLTFITIGIMPYFLKTFTENKDIIQFALDYSRIAFLGAVIITTQIALEKTFQAVGMMKVSMAAMMAGFITNIILDPMMIFGFGPIPKMGIKGAALATVLGQMVTLIIYILVFKKKGIGVTFDFKNMKESRFIVKRLYSVGIPGTLNMALPSVLITALNGILSNDTYVLLLGSYYKLQTFLYLTVNGIVQGIRPIVGYNYGAKEMKRVKQIFFTALGLAAFVMFIGTVLCHMIPRELIGIFVKTEETAALGVTTLKIISLGFIISSISVIACGTLEGLGKGLPSLIISVFRYVVVIIPVAYILNTNLGVNGVWAAFPVTEIIVAIVSFVIICKVLGKKEKFRGRYNNDYSPKYKEPYDIYAKARDHARNIKKNSNK